MGSISSTQVRTTLIKVYHQKVCVACRLCNCLNCINMRNKLYFRDKIVKFYF